MTRGAWLLVLGFAGLALGAWLLLRVMTDDAAPVTASPGATAPARTGAATAPPASPPALAGSASAGTPGIAFAAFDCAHPRGDAARIDGSAITLADLCARLVRLGAVTPAGTARAQARHVLERMIDARLVRRALDGAGASVSDAEVAAAVAATAGSAADPGVLAEQLRERLELQALVQRRAQTTVTERDVDAELAAGAPGIDRGQGVRVDGWIARVPPDADADALAAAQARAQAFAKALDPAAPATAAAAHRLTPLAPFVVGETGVEPDLQAAAFALREGAWSAPVRTRVGWAVIRVLGAVDGTRLDDQALRARVRAALETRRRQAVQQRLLEELRAAATIEIVADV